MTQQTYKSATRRYMRTFIPTIIAYVVLCFAVPIVLKTTGMENTWWVGSLALLNAAPIALILWLLLRLSRETDEYTRLQQLESIAEGAAIAVALSAFAGFLELYQVIEPLWTFWVGPVFFIGYGLAAFRRRLPKAFWL